MHQNCTIQARAQRPRAEKSALSAKLIDPVPQSNIKIMSKTVTPWLDHGVQKKLKSLTGCRGQAHYCTNVEKRLCHAVT